MFSIKLKINVFRSYLASRLSVVAVGAAWLCKCFRGQKKCGHFGSEARVVKCTMRPILPLLASLLNPPLSTSLCIVSSRLQVCSDFSWMFYLLPAICRSPFFMRNLCDFCKLQRSQSKNTVRRTYATPTQSPAPSTQHPAPSSRHKNKKQKKTCKAFL